MYEHLRPKNIPVSIDLAFREYASSKYPEEVCAFVVDDQLLPVENIAEDRNNFFLISKKDHLLLTKATAFLHSHTNGIFRPSVPDMKSQIAANIIYGLCLCNGESASEVLWWGDHLLDMPLLGRRYIYPIVDCYHVIRSAFYQKFGIKLRDFPRTEEGANLYDTHMADANGTIVDSLEPYDVIFMKVASRHTDHAALYLGNNKILHHPRNKLSAEVNLIGYQKFINKIVRYSV